MEMTPRSQSRFGRGAVTAIGLVATLLIVVALNVLGHRYALRIDVTSTGALRPSPRTLAVLDTLTGETEIILAAGLASPTRDRTAMARVLDMLDELGRASPLVRTTVIDTSTAQGQEQFEQLIGRLASERRGETQSALNTTRAAMAALGELGKQMQGWSETVGALPAMRSPDEGGVNPWTNPMAQQASYLRVMSGQVGEVGTRVEEHLGQRLGGVSVPDIAQARRLVGEAHAALASLIQNTVQDLHERSQDAKLSPEGRSQIVALIASMTGALDACSLAIGALGDDPVPVLSRVAQALSSGEAAIVVGADGRSLVALSIDDLVPGAPPGAARIDAGRHAESLLVSAISSTMSTGPRATVVLVHAGEQSLLDQAGALTQLVRSTSIHGVEWLEWPVALSPERPVDVALAAGKPGTVFVMIGLSTTAAGGPERSIRAGAVLGQLLDEGVQLMVCLAPSTLPGVGEPDPMNEPLGALGLNADTGRPTLVERTVGDRRFVEWEQLVQPRETGHALAEVVRELPTRLTWPVVIDREQEIGRAWPLIRIAETSAWRESEWVGYWLTRDTDRPGIGNAPDPGGPRDAGTGEGVLAWAIERPVGNGSQRVVVVGSHLWLFDMVARRTSEIEGRIVETSPGNTELARASIDWLAGQDAMIARSGDAAAFPIVQPMGEGRLRALRWFFIGGLPMLVLILGAVVRLMRG